MLNIKEKGQARRRTYKMYIKPEFEIVEINDEDVIATSLNDEGSLDLGGLGNFEWF